MKKLFFAVTLASASISQADIIKCTFTEPFVSTQYSMSQSKLTYTDHSMQTESVIDNVSFQIVSAGKFLLLDRGGAVLQTLELNMNGTDGMSDNIYPYEVIDKTGRAGGAQRGAYGGCTSNRLASTNPYK